MKPECPFKLMSFRQTKDRASEELVSPLFMMVSDGYVGKRASATAKAAWAPQEGASSKAKLIRLQPRMHMIHDFRRLKEILHLTIRPRP